MRFKETNKCPDTIDKIITTYFAVVTKQEFVYRDKVYVPKPYIVSSSIFNQFTCPAGCGGCCIRFSLDYIPEESYNVTLTTRLRPIIFNYKKYIIFSDLQEENKNHYCKHVNYSDGRCNIYDHRPFSCDFELIRFLLFKSPKSPNRITTRIFGRGWQYRRIDGKQGALCVVTPIITEESINEVKRKFLRLSEWCNFFELKNSIPQIIKWIDRYKMGLVKPKLLVNP